MCPSCYLLTYEYFGESRETLQLTAAKLWCIERCVVVYVVLFFSGTPCNDYVAAVAH